MSPCSVIFIFQLFLSDLLFCLPLIDPPSEVARTSRPLGAFAGSVTGNAIHFVVLEAAQSRAGLLRHRVKQVATAAVAHCLTTTFQEALVNTGAKIVVFLLISGKVLLAFHGGLSS